MTPSSEQFYLDLARPLLVYQRRGGLVVVPFTLDRAPHVVTVRIDPLTDDETVEIIPSYRHNSGMALAALVEGLDAVRDTMAQARERGHDEAVCLCERAVGAIQDAAQDAAEARYTTQPEQRPQVGAVSPQQRVRSVPTRPMRSRRGARTASSRGAR